jgi:hypothetical protein
MPELSPADAFITAMFFVAGIFALMVAQRQWGVPGGRPKAFAYAALGLTLFGMIMTTPMQFSAFRFLSILCLWGVELTDYAPEGVQVRRRRTARQKIAERSGKAA